MTEGTFHTAHGQDGARAQQHARLGQMAGQIAEFFKSYPEEQAVPAIADHINQFWSRRMREDLLAAFDANAPDLQPLVRKAMAGIKAPQNQG